MRNWGPPEASTSLNPVLSLPVFATETEATVAAGIRTCRPPFQLHRGLS
jgi:hypothetical protein